MRVLSSTIRPYRIHWHITVHYKAQTANINLNLSNTWVVVGKNSDSGLNISGKEYCFQNGGVHAQPKHSTQMSAMQSCHELPMGTPPLSTRDTHRVRANMESHYNKLKALHVPWTSGTATAQSCHEIYAQSHVRAQSTQPLGMNRQKLVQELLKPLHRQDIFYGGSIASLPQYKSQPDLKSYITSVTVIPQMGAEGRANCVIVVLVVYLTDLHNWLTYLS